MKEEFINLWLKSGILRKRHTDKEKIKSLIGSSQRIAEVIKTFHLNEDNATIIFREIYESIRQLGEAKWLILGYEPTNHEISLDALKDLDVKDKTLLNRLDRFKKIRHDANYRGIMVMPAQAEEIIGFWDKCCLEIVSILNKEIQ